MQTAAELKNLLQCIDHKGYPAYKDTRGTYEFPGYVLSIDHVQGDPFAAPSKVSIHVRGKRAGFPEHLYQKDCRRIAVQDCLLRQFARQVEKVSFKAKGSGKSGLMAVSRPGQEVLERSACQMDAKTAISCCAWRLVSRQMEERSIPENSKRFSLIFCRSV